MTLRLIATIIGHDETVKVYRDVDWNEYRVRIVGADATTTYHTDDKTDAMETARYLAGQCETA